MSRMKVLYVGVQDRSYPRNHRLRLFLEQNVGAEVDILDLPRRQFRRNLATIAKLLVSGRNSLRYDLVVLAEFNLEFTPIVRLLARRAGAAFVVDWFVGLYETRVADPGLDVSFVKRILYRMLDGYASRAPDLVLTDTKVRAENLRSAGASRVLSLPVGAPRWARPTEMVDGSSVASPLRVLYYGNYVPLHGVPTILAAVAEARQRREVSLTLVGEGDSKSTIKEMAARMGLRDICRFRDPVVEPELRRIIADHDVILGVFGSSDKAGSVLPNKVWQGLACGKPVITRRTPAAREVLDLVGEQLIQVEEGNAKELASALVRIRTLSRAEWMCSWQRLERYVAGEYEVFGSLLAEMVELD